MSQRKIKFEDASGYDQMMGFWSQLVGDKFLKWLAPKKGQRWLDIGCGGGAFTAVSYTHLTLPTILLV